ncbi:secoisolariciresinol dehydrogenase-like [Eucalyptus grandis]|uniref:secoisolariciresinol dehydrogenase-like n=1 Tax=Eucalyptus grandis TaxID=71139 RepID=UPI000527A4C9|nr:secoisolariciresinol dehydrogenase-like [Eucalyptus grandis]
MVNKAAVGDEAKSNILYNERADFERVVSVNLTDVFLRTKHSAQALIPSRRGSIINVGSFSSGVGWVASLAYTSSKYDIMELKRSVATELGHGVRVNSLQKRHLTEAALFLGSYKSKYISGHNLAVDGGFTTINTTFGLCARA